MLFYSIAHYYDVDKDVHYYYGTSRGNKKYKNIESHINAFKKINIANKSFVITSVINTARGDKRYETVKNDLYTFCKNLIPNNDIYVIVEYNWGGTIAGLWNAYKLLKDKEGYIAHFEEDFGPKNTKWFEDSVKLLVNNNYIYIGESNIGRIKKLNDDSRLTFWQYKNSTRLGDPEVWTDGGYYFSTIKNLKLIDEKIGCFHKGNQNTKYINLTDGIDFGEVGFPTLLHHAGFKFNVLKREDYFVNEWND